MCFDLNARTLVLVEQEAAAAGRGWRINSRARQQQRFAAVKRSEYYCRYFFRGVRFSSDIVASFTLSPVVLEPRFSFLFSYLLSSHIAFFIVQSDT